MTNWLITGAGGGLGQDLAAAALARGDKVVATMRSAEAAAAFSASAPGRALGLVLDLARPENAAAVVAEAESWLGQVDRLVNNAGFGLAGAFADTDWNQEAEMLQVNIVAVTHLTKLFLPQIRARQGKVLNVASTAAFQPGPFMAVYYATKAYLLSFTEALAEELEGTGVTVTCLCPGPVKTNFQRRAYLEDTRVVNSPLFVDVRDVARIGYEGMHRGKRIVIPGWKNRVGVEMLRISPRATVTKVVRKIQEKKNG